MVWPALGLRTAKEQKRTVKVIEHKGRITAAHGLFNRIRQVAPVYTPSSTFFLRPIRVHIPNDISIDSDVFAGLTIVPDRQTDRQGYTVCNNGSHLRTQHCDAA